MIFLDVTDVWSLSVILKARNLSKNSQASKQNRTCNFVVKVFRDYDAGKAAL